MDIQALNPSVALVPGYSRVYALNGYSPFKEDGTAVKLYRYVPLLQAAEDFDKSTLIFVSPLLWKDRYERRFLYTRYRNFTQNRLRCLCFSSSAADNEEAAWKVYGYNVNDTIIREAFRVDALLEQLDNFAVDNGARVFIGSAVYGLDTDEINALHKDESPRHECFFPQPFAQEHYLTLMLIKRKAFQYENEVRIFLSFDGVAPDSEALKETERKKLLCEVNVDYTHILEQLRVSPLCTHPDTAKKLVSCYFKDIPCTASRLYESGFMLNSAG